MAAGELIDRYRDRIVDLADEAGGRIIDWAGDGCFLTFETVSSAVIFVAKLLQILSGDAAIPAVRIGINVGEVTERSEKNLLRIDGLAVDLASRICSLAHPNQVLMPAARQSAGLRMGHTTSRAPSLPWKFTNPGSRDMAMVDGRLAFDLSKFVVRDVVDVY